MSIGTNEVDVTNANWTLDGIWGGAGPPPPVGQYRLLAARFIFTSALYPGPAPDATTSNANFDAIFWPTLEPGTSFNVQWQIPDNFTINFEDGPGGPGFFNNDLLGPGAPFSLFMNTLVGPPDLSAFVGYTLDEIQLEYEDDAGPNQVDSWAGIGSVVTGGGAPPVTDTRKNSRRDQAIEDKADANTVAISNLQSQLSGLVLNDLTDVGLSGVVIGEHLTYSSGQWTNLIQNSGTIKANTFDTNLTSGASITLTGVTTEQLIEYRITGETFANINFSGFPTSSPPQNVNGGVLLESDFYTSGAAPGDDRFIQNPTPGQQVIYRIEGNYNNKPSGNAGRIQIRQFNPLSGFSLEQSVPLAAGITSDSFVVNMVSFSDSANLLPPAGTGTGYQFGVSSTTSLDVVIESISRIDINYNTRV